MTYIAITGDEYAALLQASQNVSNSKWEIADLSHAIITRFRLDGPEEVSEHEIWNMIGTIVHLGWRRVQVYAQVGEHFPASNPVRQMATERGLRFGYFEQAVKLGDEHCDAVIEYTLDMFDQTEGLLIPITQVVERYQHDALGIRWQVQPGEHDYDRVIDSGVDLSEVRQVGGAFSIQDFFSLQRRLDNDLSVLESPTAQEIRGLLSQVKEKIPQLLQELGVIQN